MPLEQNCKVTACGMHLNGPAARAQQSKLGTLCGHAAKELCAFRWGFRFKEAAGAFWTAQDPFWSEGDRSSRSLMQRLFLANGSVCAPPDDPIFGDHERQWRFTKSKGGKPGHFIQVAQQAGVGDCSLA
jgi:hypothetical protein